MAPINAGLIGCGYISKVYFETGKNFDILDIVACADIIPERAQARAAEYHIPKVCSVEELVVDPEIEVVINLTVPNAHAPVALAAMQNGKSVYSEKPLATTREDGRQQIELARERNLRIGCAPDTVLGGGLQTCRKLIDDGWIGQPIAATAFMLSHGVEHWHPDPAFFYQPGSGPLFDMGPYYLTALINLLGPVQQVSGATRITFPERRITSEPLFGATLQVNTPTHVTGILEFASGAIGTMITSFDVWAHHLPRIEIYGTEGTLSVPDPNTFGGPVRVRRAGADEWSQLPLTHGYATNSRGLGIADMAAAMRSGRPHRTNGEVAYHVLDIMQAFYDSAEEGRRVELSSTCERPAPLPLGLPAYILDE